LMAIGQVSELVVLALMPLLARRFSRKTLLTVGIIAYAVRMALFAYVGQIEQQLGIPPIVTLIAGISMHGLCFGCFIFVAFMIVDEETTADVRASAQSLFNLVIIGFGIIVGSKIATEIADWSTIGDEVNYTQLFGAPMWAAVLTLIAFLFLYPGKKASDNPRVSA
jgi:MFS family permease